ncbi:MAG: hypothetical protein KDA85_19325, partial [Planctomycetaceae bacterium]|nr:hypothetical protein [Planctomycetaceae bacterium]
TIFHNSSRVLEGVYAPGLQFTADGTAFLARGGQIENDIYLIDDETGQVQQTFQGHQATASDQKWLAGESRLVSVGDTNGRAWGTGTLRVWDSVVGQEMVRLESGGARAVAVSADGRTIAVTTADGPVRIYDSRRFMNIAGADSAN